MTNLKNSTCDKTQKNYDKTQKNKLWQNSKNQIVTKIKKSNCDSSNSDTSDGSSYSEIF